MQASTAGGSGGVVLPPALPTWFVERSPSPSFPVYVPSRLRLGQTKAFPGEVIMWHNLMKDNVSDLESTFDPPSINIHALDTPTASDCLLRLLHRLAPTSPQTESSLLANRPLFDLPPNVFTCTQDIVILSFLQVDRRYKM